MEGTKWLKLELETLGFPRFVIFGISRRVLNGPEFNVQQRKVQLSMFSVFTCNNSGSGRLFGEAISTWGHLFKTFNGNVYDIHYLSFLYSVTKSQSKNQGCSDRVYINYSSQILYIKWTKLARSNNDVTKVSSCSEHTKKVDPSCCRTRPSRAPQKSPPPKKRPKNIIYINKNKSKRCAMLFNDCQCPTLNLLLADQSNSKKTA